VVKDTMTGHTYLTVVNALPARLTIDVKGITIPVGSKMEGFGGKVTDKSVTWLEEQASGSQLNLPPYSVRVVTIQ
jgi:hypothetical protein